MLATMTLVKWLPGVAQFRGYQRGWLRGDVLAGLTVAAYLVPQVMAYATVAGLPPVAGLWAALAPLALYALLGSSRQLSVGPESTTALMTAVVLAPIVIGDPARYAALAAVLALLVGAICLLGGIARLGFLANLLSRPVLIGYMTGIAIVMIASQLGKITGVAVQGDEFTDQMASFAAGIGQVHWPTLVLAALVLLLLLSLAHWLPRAPGPVIAVLVATASVGAMSLDTRGIAVVGDVPSGLPTPGLPPVSLSDLATLVVPAVGIAIVAFSDNVLSARAFATRRSEVIDANAELRAVGMCNLAAGVTHGFPVSSSGSRTAIGNIVGSRTQLYSLTTLGCVIVVLVFAGGVLAMFPTAALGALVVFAALHLIDIAEFRRLARFRRSELVLALATTAAVLAFGVLYGVVVAVVLSILELLRRLAHAHDSVLGFVPGIAGMHDIDDYPGATRVPGLVVYRYDAPLCFANAEDFRIRALAAVFDNPEPVEWFVLNAESNVEVDLTALDALEQLRVELARRGIVFAMARVKQDLRESLDAAGILDEIGEDRIFMTLPTAVDEFKRRNRS
ncbi:SulP family inorganic anion transporter [Mycobacterium sp. 29Ha]|uniref:SulP family inorganic anion transporter n=1 Tax=Mycobacterium sp. 29Ha TaxID=2939268 RepID=UPI0029391EBF|nr:SulP family inorganic anion transporter [Mycobacterium sp. 29Ha]MDV3133779.1 SulP family inorganic anion transporter [Mycobacterium sp. 29Ha]